MIKLLQTIIVCFGICICFHNSLHAQEAIVEQIRSHPNSPFKFKHNFPKKEYTKISDQNGRKIYVLNKSLSHNSLNTVKNNVPLNINLVFNPDEYELGMIIIYNEGGYRSTVSWNGENPLTVNVPASVYDLFVHFNRNDGTDYIVIKELVDVEENNTIEINVSEANNYISTKLINQNEEILSPGILNSDTGTTTGGNAEVVADRLFYFNPTNTRISNFGFLWSYKVSEDEKPSWNFYINNISDRYTIAQNIFAVGYEGDNYFSKYPLLKGITESVNLKNSSNDYIYHLEKFQPSILGESAEAIYTGLSTYNTWEGVSRGGWGIGREIEINPEEGFRAYLNNPLNESPYDLLVFPGIIDYIGTINSNAGDEAFLIEGNCIIAGEDGRVLYGSGAEVAGSWNFLGNQYYNVGNFNTGIGEAQFLPFHNQFTFDSYDNTDIIQGNNVPISVVGTMMLPAFGMNYFQSNYKGRYGEMRESDFFNTTVEAKQNDAVIFSGNYIDFKPLLPLSSDGTWDITFVNTNTRVDGLEGKNTTRLLYEGEAAPTLQHLQFRNTDGQVTDHFESAQSGIVRLAAGDFEFDAEASVFTYKEGNSVNFYYSKHDQNNWTELPLTNYPEYFQMPAFGDYYEASLADVNVPEKDTWFDVRIVCTDGVGNKQEQIISPAFKVEQSTLGVDDISKSNFIMYPNPVDNILNISNPKEIKEISVYDLTGKQVLRNLKADKGQINVSKLLPGNYILNAVLESGKTETFKIIKK